MTADAFKVTIHMVSSLDGFIAKKDGTVSWLETSDHYGNGVKLTEDDMDNFIKSIDCYVMGARTYEHALALGWPYGDVTVMVLTHRNLLPERESVEFHSGDLDKFVNQRLKPNYRNVWLVGGSMLAKDFIRCNLVDDIRLMIAPIILGDGTLFFDYIGRELPLHLKDVTAYESGFVELWYEIRKSP